MDLRLSGPMVPVALGGIALAAALYEHALAEPDARAAGSAGAAVAALSALATLLLGMPGASLRTHVVAALVGGAIWLAGRARRDERLEPPLLCLLGIVTGLRPFVGVALAPFALGVLIDLMERSHKARSLLRLAVIFVIGAALGLVLAAPDGPVGTMPGSRELLAWVGAAAHASGVAALAVACAGLLLGALGSAPRRTLAWVAALLVLGEAHGGVVGPLSCVAIALGVGLALVEFATRIAHERTRMALALLAPVVLLVVAEPVSARLDAVDWAPSFGPVPPRVPVSPSPRPAAAPARRSPERRP